MEHMFVLWVRIWASQCITAMNKMVKKNRHDLTFYAEKSAYEYL